MPNGAAPDEVRGPLTRRQIRQVERARATDGTFGAPSSAAPPLHSPATAGMRSAEHGTAALTEELTTLPARSRRELRSRPEAPDGRRPRRLLPRTAVLSVLGLTTIALPVVGLDGADHSAHAHEAAASAVQIQSSVLDLLDSRAAAAQVSSPAPPGLLANPAARARAESLQASRAAERGALDGADVEGAHGTIAAAVPEERIVMPLPQGTFRTTSSYGGRADPFTGSRSSHTGVDLGAPAETPIYAVADGVVDYVGPGKAGRSGMIIVLEHEIDGRVVYSWYNHMYASGLYVEVGQQVQAGDVIAGVGNNGRSTGPHLHFELHTDADLTTTDPMAWLREQGAVDAGELA